MPITMGEYHQALRGPPGKCVPATRLLAVHGGDEWDRFVASVRAMHPRPWYRPFRKSRDGSHQRSEPDEEEGHPAC